MIRNVITINEELCDGCGVCVTSCVEGALQLIDGKARLISEMYCDGLGACIGNCPQSAISVETRECGLYDEIRTLENILPKGMSVVAAHLQHLFDHGQMNYFDTALTYLKTRGMEIERDKFSRKKVSFPDKTERKEKSAGMTGLPTESELQNWPIQLHLINPLSDSFYERDLLIAADCVPFALNNFHEVLLMNKAVIIACPKLDTNKDVYLQKLRTIFSKNKVRSVTVAVMEVPCCSGLVHLVKQALEQSKADIEFEFKVISIDGNLLKR